MIHRSVVAAAVAASLLGAGVAEAKKAPAPKPVCDLIQGTSGDSSVKEGPATIPGDGSVDLVSADIASNAATLTAVVRLAGLSNPDPQSPTGQGYAVYFTAPHDPTLYFLQARLYPTNSVFVFGYQGSDPTTGITTLYPAATATGVIDVAHNQVRISVPLSAVRSTVKLASGLRLSSLEAKSFRIFGQGEVPSQQVGPVRVPFGGLSLTFDDDISASTYTMGAPSCVPVGH